MSTTKGESMPVKECRPHPPHAARAHANYVCAVNAHPSTINLQTVHAQAIRARR
jgi:hypothetical protein